MKSKLFVLAVAALLSSALFAHNFGQVAEDLEANQIVVSEAAPELAVVVDTQEEEKAPPTTSFDVAQGEYESPTLEPAPVEIKQSNKIINTAEVKAVNPEEVIYTTMETQSGAPWGLDRIDGARDGVYNYISTGSGVRIYIVDTGVDASHKQFGSRVTQGFDAFGENLANTDCKGHGSHVAGIAAGEYYGVAKKATIVPVRVLDCNGVGTTSTLGDGIEWILSSHPGGVGIVNMSLGGEKDPVINSLVEELVASGFIVVAAAGNSSADACNYSPASANGVIAVGAITDTDSRASFSNYGSCVDIYAPGERINSVNALNHSISLKMSGTSQAAPFVAGAIATYLSEAPAMTARQAETLMNELAQDGVVTVQAEPEQPVEPTPEPVVEPEPVAPEPEPSNPPVVDEPSLPDYSVTVTQWEPGKGFASLEWSPVEGASSYRIYKTGSIRPGWRLYWTTDENGYIKTVSDAIGAIAIYRVTAVVGGSEVELGEVQYEPTD